MRPLLITIGILLSLGKVAFAQTSTWKVNDYTIRFEIDNAGVAVDGSLRGLKYQLDFAPEALSSSSLFASVAVSTIDTGIGARDRHLQSDTYFNSATWPLISLQSTSLQQIHNTQFVGVFNCTIKDTTQQVSIPFSFETSNKEAVMEGRFSLNRQDYGIGGNSLLMGDEIEVTIRMILEKNG
ncbi:MAG: YceI family protein [Bacteroidota bacterium]